MKAAVLMEGLAMEDVGNVEVAVNGETRMTTENQVSWKHTPVFEELIRDNDIAINADFVVSNPKVNQPDPTRFQDNNGCDLIEVEVTEDNPMNEKWNLKTKVDKDNVNSSGVASKVGFKVGFEGLQIQFKVGCGNGQGSKGTSKGQPKRSDNKDKGVSQSMHSPKVVKSVGKSTLESSKAMLNWKRLTTRPQTFSNSSIVDLELGKKRKQTENLNKEATAIKGEKKHRIVENEQGVVSTMGLVEVVRQPCQT